jgi:DNA-binding CsgD family transcriptional regulator
MEFAAVTSPSPHIDETDRAAAPAPSPLLEREAELAAITALVEAAGAGAGRLIAFEGRAGVGKSRLVAATRETAAAAGLEVISARSGELEQDFAYGVVRQLFEPLLSRSSGAERAKLLAGAAGLAKPLFESSQLDAVLAGTSDMSFPVMHGLYWLVANFAARRPTLLTIDDLHWCDRPSLRWLVYLSRRLEGLPLLVAVSLRPAGEGQEAALLTELVSDPAAAVVHPGGLSLGSIATLTRDTLGAEPDHEFCAACREATNGNPLFIRALLDTLAKQGVSPRADEAQRLTELGPEAVPHAISLRLLRLSAEATALVRAVAILGDGAALGQAGTLAELEPAAAAKAALELVRSDLLRTDSPLEFVHPVVRTAIYEAMGGGARIDAHRRAAVLVLEGGALPQQAAAHLMLTEPTDDPFVVTTLRQAAERSIGEGAPDAAAAYLSRALIEPPAPEQRIAVLSELGTAEMHTDERTAVEHLRLAMESSNDVEQRATRALEYGQALIYLGRQGEAVELYSRTLEQLGDRRPDLSRLLEGELNLAAWCEPELCQLAAERLVAVHEDELQNDLGSTALLGALALSELRSGASRKRAVALATRVVESDLAAAAAYLVIDYATFALTAAGEVDTAAQASERALSLARSRGDRLSVNDLLVLRAFLHAQRGNLQQAESDLAATEDGPLTVVMSAYATGFLAEVLVDRGRADEAAAATNSVTFTSVPLGHRLLFVYGRARARQASGATEQALGDFMQLGENMQTLGVRNPAFAPWRSQAALALHALGRTQEACNLAEEELELARLWGAPRTIGISMRALGLVQGGRAGEELLRDAVAVLTDSPARLEHARTLIDLGAALRRANNRSEARALLRDGIDLALGCGAGALVARANDELAATGAHRRTVLLSGLDALTASERRVAQMAAHGLSNKEIAQDLFVTVKTVEVHLSRVYRKLGISSRVGLSPLFGQPSEATTAGSG